MTYLLPLNEEEAAAVAVALVSLIHDKDTSSDRWRENASKVAFRLERVRSNLPPYPAVDPS